MTNNNNPAVARSLEVLAKPDTALHGCNTCDSGVCMAWGKGLLRVTQDGAFVHSILTVEESGCDEPSCSKLDIAPGRTIEEDHATTSNYATVEETAEQLELYAAQALTTFIQNELTWGDVEAGWEPIIPNTVARPYGDQRVILGNSGSPTSLSITEQAS